MNKNATTEVPQFHTQLNVTFLLRRPVLSKRFLIHAHGPVVLHSTAPSYNYD